MRCGLLTRGDGRGIYKKRGGNESNVTLIFESVFFATKNREQIFSTAAIT